MLKLIIHEKINNKKNTIINISMWTIFFLTFYIVICLIAKLYEINNSEWFMSIRTSGSEELAIILKQIKTMSEVIVAYGVTALIIVSIIFTIFMRNYIKKGTKKGFLLSALGYSRQKIKIRVMEEILCDMLLGIMISLIIACIIMPIVYHFSGIERMLEMCRNYNPEF